MNWKMPASELKVRDGKFDPSGELPKGIRADQWVMPGFIDAHCHILPTGLDLVKLNLGACQSKQDVLDSIRDHLSQVPEGAWLHAVHYDQTKFTDATHIHLNELDAISKKTPILLRHVNGHASVANSKTLALAQVTEESTDPVGGTIGRDEQGLTGLLLERAHELVTAVMPEPSLDAMVDAILLAAKEMSKFGITCATDMMTGRWNLAKEIEAYSIAAQTSPIRFRLFVQWAEVLHPKRGMGVEKLREIASGLDRQQCKICGLKVFADGAIGSATAAIHSNFLTTGGKGQLIYSEEKLLEIIRQIDATGYPAAIHTIGDRSTDLVIEGYSKTNDPSRHRIEHAMILSDRQLDQIAELKCHVTMQPEFLTRFRHSYQKQLAPDLFANLKRVRSLLDRGIRLSFNSDRPIVLGDPWVGIGTAVSRPEGYNQAENIRLEEAVVAYTKGGADANGDDGLVGELVAGQWADFQVYEKEPAVGLEPVKVFLAGNEVHSQSHGHR